MANANAIYKTMAQVTVENLNMDHWAGSDEPRMTCNTTMCLAGHAVVAAGKALAWVQDTDSGEWQASTTTDGRSVEHFAAEYLGLDDDQANDLFFETPADTPEALWDAIEHHTGVKRPSLVSA
jgi:hypothetical protein